jgi:hypothetical protein
MTADAAGPLSDIDHPAWRVREQLRREAYAAGAAAVSEQMVGAVEALLELGDDGALRAGMTLLCQVWRVQQGQQSATTIDASRAQSAAELLDQFLTDLDTWASRCGLPGAPVSLPAIRWFVEGWLAAGEIPPPPDADAIEDAQCITTQAAIAHIDALTRGKP